MMSERTPEWYDVFWDAAPEPDKDDNGAASLRLLAELLDSGCIWRDGDNLCSDSSSKAFVLSPEDQFLVRLIENAVNEARKANQ